MNKVVLIGNLTKDPESRSTSTGKKVVSFSIAVNDGKDASGKELVQYFNLTAWDQRADIVEQYVKKGHKICAVGKITNKTYTKQDGTTAYTTDITVQEIELLTSKIEAERLANMPQRDNNGGYQTNSASSNNQSNSNQTSEKESGSNSQSTKPQKKEELPEIDINSMDLNVQMPF